jgi:hypothetical protein
MSIKRMNERTNERSNQMTNEQDNSGEMPETPEVPDEAEITDVTLLWRDHPREGFFVSEAMVEQVARYITHKARAGQTTTKQEIMEALSYSFMAVHEAVNILSAEGVVCIVSSPASR